jgi:prepilin-type N-terminal cleavage/methylation domain-containing protein
MEREPMSKAVARVATWLRSRLSADGGFTLVEVVISVSLLGLITGAATTSMITATNGARMTSQRAHESTDAQLISAFLVRDAQAAGGSNPKTGTIDSTLGVTLVPGTTDACTPTNTRVRFNWIDRIDKSTNHANSAAYALDTATHQLVRRSCRDGVSSGDMVLGTRVASFNAVCNPIGACPGLPDLVTVTVTELSDPSYPTFTYDLVAQLRPEAQKAPSIFTGTPLPLMALGGASCPSSKAFIDLHGSSTLQVQLGGVVVNSPAVLPCVAVNIGGSGTYSADNTSVLSPGTCPAGVTGCTTFTQPLSDPLAGLPTPPGDCSTGSDPVPISGVYQPGVYHAMFKVNSSTTATFADGTYIFCNGLDVKTTVDAPHVLFYFAGGSLTVNSTGTVTIGSQLAGDYRQVSIWQPHSDDVKINGGAGLDSYKGIIYAPLSVVYITGGTNLQIGSVIAYAIDVGGTGYASFGPGVTIVTPALPPAFVGVFYSVTMAAAGGPPTPTPPPLLPRYRNWQASNLPSGLSINADSGVLSGTTNVAATYPNVVISVTDYVPIIPVTTTRTYTLNVGSGSLAIASASPLAQATVSTNYSMTFEASGGNLGLTGAYQWTNSTPLPAGLSWTGNGVISGSPSAVGSSKTTPVVPASTRPSPFR